MANQVWREAVNIVRLESWMDAQGLGATAIENIELLGGGTQNILLKFTRSGRDYVLRRPPLHLRANSNETMRREARVLAALSGTNVPHPRFIAACPDESVIGAAFYLMQPVDGFNATVGLPELHRNSREIRHQMGLALMDALASLGEVDYEAVGLADLGRLDGFMQRQVGRWNSQFESYASFAGWSADPVFSDLEQIASWLEAKRPQTFTPGIMHGDYHLANVMFSQTGPEIAAIVDWELVTIGDPLIDLGWVLATWPDEGASEKDASVRPWDGFPAATELIERYSARSKRDLSCVDWYHVFACYKLGILLEGTYARACANKAPKATGDYLHSKAMGLIQRASRLLRNETGAI